MSDYVDIFNIKFTSELPPNYLGDYAITINNKNLLYKSLYGFFIKKLEVLHQYLNKNLEKGWIKPFINLIGVFILFIPKKDKSL